MKLGPTMDQINNPQSACGSVCSITFGYVNFIVLGAFGFCLF